MHPSRIRRLIQRANQVLAQHQLRTSDKPIWTPFSGPQTDTLQSQADELFYGGAAGGGKTDLMLGAALTQHKKTLFLRREASQLTRAVGRIKIIVSGGGRWSGSGHGGTMRFRGREVQMGGCEHEDDREKYQGHDDDLKCFDELAHFTRSQYRFIIGWTRTDDPRQRCRVIAAGNPPTTPEGRWVVEEWAPWLDPGFVDPARPGELRWYTYLDDKLCWFRTGDEIVHKGERIKPRSRTFIPARVQDNPVYMASGYLARLQSMPEPLRSQMLYGDFGAGTEDHRWQLIPTAWVFAAFERWKQTPKPTQALDAIGCDVAMGGSDKTAIAKRYGRWIGPIIKRRGVETPDGNSVLALLFEALQDGPGAVANIDTTGIGKGAYDATQALEVPMRNARAVVFSEATDATDANGVLRMANVRAAMYWHVRELLDPAGPADTRLCLPPDPEILSDLTAPRWFVRSGKAYVEPKDDGLGGGIRQRLGRSPDVGDAVVLACWQPKERVPVFSKSKR